MALLIWSDTLFMTWEYVTHLCGTLKGLFIMRSSLKSLPMWDLPHTYLTPLQFNPIQFNLGCHNLSRSKKALTKFTL